MSDEDIIWMASDDPLVISVVEAIHTGDVSSLKQLLAGNPRLATARITGIGAEVASNAVTGNAGTDHADSSGGHPAEDRAPCCILPPTGRGISTTQRL